MPAKKATDAKKTKKETAAKDAPKKEAPKKVAAKKKTTKSTSAKYRLEVQDYVLPNIHAHTTPRVVTTMPAELKGLDESILPKKIQGDRLFLTDDVNVTETLPSLIEMQIESYKWFLTDGIQELLQEITPITDFSGKKMELRVLGHTFDPPKYDPETCRRRNLSYDAVMKG